jgi:hypothetical protein
MNAYTPVFFESPVLYIIEDTIHAPYSLLTFYQKQLKNIFYLTNRNVA